MLKEVPVDSELVFIGSLALVLPFSLPNHLDYVTRK